MWTIILQTGFRPPGFPGLGIQLATKHICRTALCGTACGNQRHSKLDGPRVRDFALHLLLCGLQDSDLVGGVTVDAMMHLLRISGARRGAGSHQPQHRAFGRHYGQSPLSGHILVNELYVLGSGPINLH